MDAKCTDPMPERGTVRGRKKLERGKEKISE
jgi:hypothetical protein